MSDLLDDNVFSLPDEEITSAGAEGNDSLEEAERTVLETPLSGEDDPFSVESSLADDFSAEEAFSEELPLEELPREDFRDELIPSDEFHAEDIPVDEPPAEDLPDDELPDDELPEAPVPPEKQSSDPAYGGDLPEDEEETGYQAQAEKAPRERYVMPRFLKTFIFAAAVFLGGFILSLFVWRAAVDVFAFSKPDREVTINIDEGSSMNDVIDDLHENGLVNYRWLFKAYCNLTHAEKKISTGTYTLNNLFDYHALVNGLRSDSGSRDIVRVMIKEGATCRQIFEQLDEILRLVQIDGLCATLGGDGVHHRVEALQVFHGQVRQRLCQHGRFDQRSLIGADDGGDLVSSRLCFGDDQLPGLSGSADHCDLHGISSFFCGIAPTLFFCHRLYLTAAAESSAAPNEKFARSARFLFSNARQAVTII